MQELLYYPASSSEGVVLSLDMILGSSLSVASLIFPGRPNAPAPSPIPPSPDRTQLEELLLDAVKQPFVNSFTVREEMTLKVYPGVHK